MCGSHTKLRVRKSGDRARVGRTFWNLDCILKAQGERKKKLFERTLVEAFKLGSAIVSSGL